ncbi:MAG: IS21 family transposase [Gammaproteobacteria bacterium]|nr:IS21 family transposase [Gammaproteobacteria bacterium]
MARERLPMRKIRDVLRLKAEGFSERKIAASLGIGHSAAGDTIRRARRAGLSWPLPDDLSNEGLERLLYAKSAMSSGARRPLPDWTHIHRELRRAGVTLSLLWEEYRAVHPDGLGRTQFCEHYRRWKGRLSPTMRQTHVAGDKMFVDYAGQTIEIMDGLTGEVHDAQLFVAVLGASSYTYAEATLTQTLPDWTGSHCRAFAFFGGVTTQVVSDNLKAGIAKACFYEPAVNRTYSDLANHYDTAVVPARPYKPRDKAKVEVGVQIAERWVLAALRNRRFFSLAELNAAIRELVDKLNNRVTRHLGASRRALFEDLDRPALKALPQKPFEYAAWKECRAGLDYHVEVEKHYYSVPHILLREKLWARMTGRTVEIFHRGKRVAAHVRSSSNRRHTTVREHMPSSHRRYADWTPERLKRKACEVGPDTGALVDLIMRERRHPEQGFRACIGIIRLARTYGPDRLEAACTRALEIGTRSYTSVNSILKNNIDRRRSEPATDGPAITHPNIRGAGYFH